jgi:hypothetical protein
MFLSHLNRELDKDKNCRTVAKLHWKERKEKVRRKHHKRRMGSVGCHGSIDLFV